MRSLLKATFSTRRRALAVGAFALLAFAAPLSVSPTFADEPTVSGKLLDDGSVRVYVDGDLFAGYVPDA
ncbi:MAG: hypothetical protein IJE97_07500, partial [Thermoguttaceae bacterium]|nr:hypothetical protein [Thermoguttaceae bacterium]